MYKSISLIFLILLFNHIDVFNQEKHYYPIAFYNVENLFDTYHDDNKDDLDFTPNGKYKWTEDKYKSKLSNIAFVIKNIGSNLKSSGPVIIGLAEIENKNVLTDLLQTNSLKSKSYKFIHEESSDNRGIDVAMIYDYDQFKVINTKVYPFKIVGRKDIKTRDILVVSGMLAQEPLTIIINHWPSRRDKHSSLLRQRAAYICKHISDSLYLANKSTNIVIMGDMNDNPSDISTRVILNAKKEKHQVLRGGRYNTMWSLYAQGKGTLKYGNIWNLFDQIIISENLLHPDKKKLNYLKSEIYAPPYLLQEKGKNKKIPFRTFYKEKFINGYSDHLPSVIYLVK